MQQIKLLFAGGDSGFMAFVDEDVFLRLYQYTWIGIRSGQCRYAFAMVNGRRQYLHRMIMNAEPGQIVDHIDGWWDCTRANLRIGSHKENMQNRGRRRGSSSRFKGVSRAGQRWRAQIEIRGKAQHLGVFDLEEDAGRAYDAAAVSAYGQWAWTNATHPVLNDKTPTSQIESEVSEALVSNDVRRSSQKDT